jgi:hypothetical protein
MAPLITAAGSTKQTPAASSPMSPACSYPMNTAKLARARSRDQIRGPEHVEESLVGEPTPAPHDLLHQCDVRGGTAERGEAQAQEQERDVVPASPRWGRWGGGLVHSRRSYHGALWIEYRCRSLGDGRASGRREALCTDPVVPASSRRSARSWLPSGVPSTLRTETARLRRRLVPARPDRPRVTAPPCRYRPHQRRAPSPHPSLQRLLPHQRSGHPRPRWYRWSRSPAWRGTPT